MTAPNPRLSTETAPPERNAFRISILYLIVVASSTPVYIYLGLQNGAWQLFVTAGISAILAGVGAVSVWLSRHGRPSTGVWLVIGATIGALLLVPILIAGFGLVGGLAVLLITLGIATQTLSQRDVNIVLAAGVGAGLVAGVVDLLSPPTQLVIPALQVFLSILAVTLTLAYLFLLFRQFRSFALSTKLLIAFLTVTLTSVGAIAAFVNITTRPVFVNSANQALLNAAVQTKTRIDQFISESQEEFKQEAALPDVVEYLSTPSAQRSGSRLEQDIAALAQAATNQNLYLSSYALLDRRGLNVFDSLASGRGVNESDQACFKNPLQTDQPSVSLLPLAAGEPALCFGNPVHGEAGEIIGVLRVRFAAAVLQQIVTESSDLAGQDSFAILLDETHLRLADALEPDLVFKPLALDATFEQGLANAASQPYFAAEVAAQATDDDPEQAAVVRLELQPWLLVFAQPRSVFMAPVEEQARVTTLLALIVAGVTAGAAFATARTLSGPVIRLTAVAERVAAGDLDAQARVEMHDEVGVLAETFNSMTAQLSGLIGSLEGQVEARTEQLRASADVGRVAISILDPNQLLREIANLITERFGFYYVAVFTADEAGKFAVLREATGEAGRVLKERSHKLEIGGQSMVGSVMTLRRPRVALDVGSEVVRFANPLLPDTRSEIALPLMVGDRVLGALDVQSTQVGAFDEASTAVLQAMAVQIAIALNNAEQFRRSEAQAKAQAELNRVGRSLFSSGDLEGLYRSLVTNAGALVPHDALSLVLSEGVLLHEYDLNLEADHVVIRSHTRSLVATLAGQALTTQRPAIRADFAQDGSSQQDVADWSQAGFHSALSVPLLLGERALGTLNFVSRAPAAFPTSVTLQAEQLASQVAVALENVRLAQAQQRSVQELEELTRQLTGQAWADQFRELPGEQQQASFARGGVNPVSQTWLPEIELAVAARKPVAWSERKEQTVSSPFQAAMAAPMVLRGEVIGALQVGEVNQARPWSAEDLAFIQAVADQVALAVENARLLDQTRRAADREKLVAEAADKIHRPIELEAILRAAIEEVSRITGAGDVSIRLGAATLPEANGNGNGAAPHPDSQAAEDDIIW
ncbi:MAG TPA: GAF domain-containing protein [Anaerolineae bacterium]|nr:GAF domain-containing protein [Anaerolineae bacterium]